MKPERLRLEIRGSVQGVGFRPFVYRLANELELDGWVRNSPSGVVAELEGRRTAEFLSRLELEKPAPSTILSLEVTHLDTLNEQGFQILPSLPEGCKSALILPDIATCAECLREIRDPGNRRYHYPFTNCTHCGPRFSIIESLPYDRSRTSMRKFAMCPACQAEYEDPSNRRFHAQPNACPDCGPRLMFLGESGDPLELAAELLRSGRILALKGIGGFQLLVDARRGDSIRRLRERKHRPDKPFAVMAPLEQARCLARISPAEERLLTSPTAPIVLLEGSGELADEVAPGSPLVGLMLPYSPLHHLLLDELGFSVVATSGNLRDEPICIDEDEALERLGGLADGFLVHDRPIVRQVDDSVTRVMMGREQVLRRARGYAPLPVRLKHEIPTILATGAHLKNTVALSIGREVFVSQHIGDLETPSAHAAFQRACRDLPALYDTEPDVIACDLHPDYLSAQAAWPRPVPVIAIQHHFAHVAACLAENGTAPPALGISWDGTGYGTDGTIWGGEFLTITAEGCFERFAHFRTFPLPGGMAAIRQPRRSALGLLHELHGETVGSEYFTAVEWKALRQALARGVNCPRTSSAGRLFDAVASLLGLRQTVTFEGQAAMALEFAAASGIKDAYPFALHDKLLDWGPLIEALLDDPSPRGVRAARFHNSLVEVAVTVARKAGWERVALTGGCFQNRYLLERTVRALQQEGFQPVWHQRIPPNDGGISLGQAVAAAWQLQSSLPCA